jgi:hypothetical protein
MPLNPPRQNLRFLHQFLSIILSEMLLFDLIIQAEDIGCGLEFRDRYEAYLYPFILAALSSLCSKVVGRWKGVDGGWGGVQRGGRERKSQLTCRPEATFAILASTLCKAPTRLFARAGSIFMSISEAVLIFVL